MLGDTSYDTSKANIAWPKWVYREMTGLKQARGKRYEAFLAALEEQTDWPAATSSGEGLKRSGIRYYKNAEELLDRLIKLISARDAGNTSAELRNEAGDILDKFWDDGEIDEPVFKGLWKLFE